MDELEMAVLGEALARKALQPPRPARACQVCLQPLGAGELKVHRGKCARARKTRLQQLRRRRARV